MVLLLLIGFLAGVTTAISPCVLPVLPILLAGGASGGRRRPYAIIAGLVLSFAVFTLSAAWIIDRLRPPRDLLPNAAPAPPLLRATTAQTALGGYTKSLQNWIERNHYVHRRLHEHAPQLVAAASGSQLADYGRAPNFTGISDWLNTRGDRPLSLASLRGKVVVVDFWTYSCLNCLRT